MSLPLFACFPICFFFTSLVIVGVIMYLAGAGATASDAARAVAPAGTRPPWWVVPAVLAAAVALLLLLSLVTDG